MKTYQETNSIAWDSEVDNNNFWTVPIKEETINKAKKGDFNIFLTPATNIKKEWLKDYRNKKILALACAGGQQAIAFAAADNDVVVFAGVCQY